jgi:hypothetical protein
MIVMWIGVFLKIHSTWWAPTFGCGVGKQRRWLDGASHYKAQKPPTSTNTQQKAPMPASCSSSCHKPTVNDHVARISTTCKHGSYIHEP